MTLYLPDVIADNMGMSRDDARNLIDGGAVNLDGAPIGHGEYHASLLGDRQHTLMVRMVKWMPIEINLIKKEL